MHKIISFVNRVFRTIFVIPITIIPLKIQIKRIKSMIPQHLNVARDVSNETRRMIAFVYNDSNEECCKHMNSIIDNYCRYVKNVGKIEQVLACIIFRYKRGDITYKVAKLTLYDIKLTFLSYDSMWKTDLSQYDYIINPSSDKDKG